MENSIQGMDFRKMRAVGIALLVSNKTEVCGDIWCTHHNYRHLLGSAYSYCPFLYSNLIHSTTK